MSRVVRVRGRRGARARWEMVQWAAMGIVAAALLALLLLGE